MTVDEAFQAASLLLDQRGQLLNAHLLRLVDGDKELFRIVRERLIHEGIAEDRSGVGLAPVESRTGNQRGAGSPVDPSPASDWWLMKAGKIRGPLDLVILCEMATRNEIESADVVRLGSRGLWKPVDSVPEIAAARRGQGSQTAESALKRSQRSRSDTQAFPSTNRGLSQSLGNAAGVLEPGANLRDDWPSDQESPGPKDLFVPPEKSWSLGDQSRPNLFRRGWSFAAGCAGGSERLSIILVVLVCAGGFYYWWGLPPSNATIYQEFTACYNAMQKLRDRRTGRSDWTPMEERFRPRIVAIITRLKPFATDKHPVEQSLYLAGSLGLLPLMEYSADPTYPEQFFNKQMAVAKQEKGQKNR